MIDTRLIDTLSELVKKEKKTKEYKSRLRIKGKITEKAKTKKGNITLTITKDKEDFKFTILKSHKERFSIAEKLDIGKSVSVEGISKFKYVICTKLKLWDKGIDESKQMKLNFG